MKTPADFYKGFYIDGPVGNNAFSYAQRKNRRIYVAPLKQGGADDLQEGEETVFSEVYEGKEVNRPGLKYFIETQINDQKLFIFDNHNHAFFFWLWGRQNGLFPAGARLIHVDQHKDLRVPEEAPCAGWDLEEAFAYTNGKLNVGNFIRPALALGLFEEVLIVDHKQAFEQPPQPPYVLDVDLDIFSKEMQYIEEGYKIRNIQRWMSGACLVTMATSPYFMDQAEAIRVAQTLITSGGS